MAVATYNPKKVLLSWGPILFEGYADGSMIEAVRNNQAVNLAIGSTGDGCRAISNDKSGTVTVNLLQSSLTNGLLNAQAIIDEESGDAVYPLFLKDLSGLDAVVAESAWIQKNADATYARETENRTWILETDSLNILVAGIP